VVLDIPGFHTFLSVLTREAHIQGVILPFSPGINSVEGDEKRRFEQKRVFQGAERRENKLALRTLRTVLFTVIPGILLFLIFSPQPRCFLGSF